MVGGLAKRKYIPHPGLSRGNSVTHELVSDVGYETCNYPSIFNRLQLHPEHLLSKKYVVSLSNLMGSILRLKWERELQHLQTAKDYKGYVHPRMWWTLQCVQYDGCSLQSYSSYPSALCGARTQTHSSTHIVLHTHSYKHLYTVSQYNTYQHKHTETQTRAKTHVHRQRHRERHMDTNWLSHKLNCLQFVQPAQLTYFAFH